MALLVFMQQSLAVPANWTQILECSQKFVICLVMYEHTESITDHVSSALSMLASFSFSRVLLVWHQYQCARSIHKAVQMDQQCHLAQCNLAIC